MLRRSLPGALGREDPGPGDSVKGRSIIRIRSFSRGVPS